MTVQLPFLPPNTIVPPVEDRDVMQQYFVRLYEEIAYNVNARDFTAFIISISATPADIPLIDQFGAYLLTISGVDSTQPVQTVSIVKSTSTAVGVINVIGTQPGTGIWAGKNIIVSSTATNFQIRHDLVGTTANFKLRIVGL